MSQSKQLPTHILIHIVEQLNVPLKSLVATITLLDGGGTVRFLRIRSAENLWTARRKSLADLSQISYDQSRHL